MKNALIAPVRGMHDILPEQVAAWQQMEQVAADCFHSYGYRELRTPLLEKAELFRRPLGEKTDVVQKEMYCFNDKADGDQLALRPEATVSTVRALLAAGRQRGAAVRVWYSGAMFRRERPQKGRYRQFHQLGAEALGSADPALDAEQIIMLARLWRALGVAGRLRLEINNLGSSEERADYRGRLSAYFERRRSDLDEDATERITTNPLRILDSKHPATLKVIAEAPPLADSLGTQSRRHLDRVKDKLTAAGIAFSENDRLVRGLDYYNLTVYEWSLADDTRRQNTVCGGGRYDGLAESIGGTAFPGCGFALGLERAVSLLGAAPPPVADCFLALADADNASAVLADTVAEYCRDEGLSVWRHVGGGKLDRQLKQADSMGAPLAIIIGESEASGDYVTIKRLADGEQRQVPPADAAETGRRLLDA